MYRLLAFLAVLGLLIHVSDMVQPEIKDHALKMGLLPIDTPSVASLRVFVQTEIVRWGKVVEQAGIVGSQ